MLSLETQLLIDKICDQAEKDWKSGFQPEIRKLVDMVDEDAVPILIAELIRVDREVNDRDADDLKQLYLDELPSGYGELVMTAIVDDYELSRFVDPRGYQRDLDFDPEQYIGQSIGNYRIDQILGIGGFGMVYRAKDKILHRHVVLKIPRGQIFGDDQRVEEFLDEAKKIAQLRHENILKVLHVGKESGQPYIVEEYFEDGDLAKSLSKGVPDTSYTLDFVKSLADAIQYAHDKGIVHRDLKPANILVGIDGEPIVGDFGLSLCAAQIAESSRHIAGTVRYMSPEQIRGETHRLDGRTDIWSMGVILYRMITGRLPFEGQSTRRVARKIIFSRPIEPRDINTDISEELNRICMRCLSPRVSDRYAKAAELSEDLNRLICNPGSLGIFQGQSRIRARGLASFDTDDRDFFLSLLPGPISRNGFPECIDFWKSRIERPDLSPPVSLILGPSGSGKSSMVGAGLLPVLNDEVEVVTINATGADTEVRLLKGLRSRFPELPNDASLPVAIAGLRERRWLPKDRRLLIVLDQFEQWLHANASDEHHQLIHALRHCDGESVMALVLVREDFFMAVSKFFSRLEVDLVERQNFSAVEMFDDDHARNVLAMFGQAFKKLPQRESEFTDAQHRFLDRSIELISIDRRVMCVRLSIFVEAIKNLPWTLETLARIGNAKEIGTYFLEQSLGEKCSNPKHRVHRKQLINVLEKLLPDAGVEIKGSFRSKQDLANAAGMNVDGSEFKTVLRILDSELRLITPTEPDGEFEKNAPRNQRSYYQLTHDYLVPSLRDWMQRVRGESRQGRAKQRLQQLTKAWESTSDSRYLPSFFEFGSIIWHTQLKQHSSKEHSFLWASAKYFGVRAVALAVVFFLIAMAFWYLNGLKAQELMQSQVDQFISSQPAEVSRIMQQLKRDPKSAIDVLNNRLVSLQLTDYEKTRVHIGLMTLGQISSQRSVFLIDRIPEAAASECPNFIEALSNDPSACKLLDQRIEATRELIEALTLQAAAEETTAQEAAAEELIETLPRWARLVIVRGFLNSNNLVEAFAFRENPELRTALIYELSSWHGDPEDIADLLEVANDPAYLAGVLLSIGQIEPGELGFNVVKQLVEKMGELYRGDPSGAVHSAAEWALNSWQFQRPTLNESENDPDKKGWWVDKSGLTMIKFLSTDANGKHYQLAISACEVPASLFHEFLQDTAESPEDRAKTDWKMTNPTHPVTKVNLEDAVLFCNWLSEKHGLQKCYKKNGRTPEFFSLFQKKWVDEIKWELIEDANGYRLPWWYEWQSAASGGTTTDYFFADQKFFPGYDRYQWSRSNSKINLQPVGKLCPNQFGLYDMLGNAAEITWGNYTLDKPRDPDCVYELFGGDYKNPADSQTIRPNPRTFFSPTLDWRYKYFSFRVVRNQ